MIVKTKTLGLPEVSILLQPIRTNMSDSTSSDPLFTPWNIGKLQLKHRIVMAPLTRNRATPSTAAPNSLIAEYYEQRASDGGLLITEVSHHGGSTCLR